MYDTGESDVKKPLVVSALCPTAMAGQNHSLGSYRSTNNECGARADHTLILQVFIASPGDTRDELDRVERAIADWNPLNAQSRGVMLRPLWWGHDSSRYSARIVNQQLLDDADIVIALFQDRLA